LYYIPNRLQARIYFDMLMNDDFPPQVPGNLLVLASSITRNQR
jgi:hypothetical protein